MVQNTSAPDADRARGTRTGRPSCKPSFRRMSDATRNRRLHSAPPRRLHRACRARIGAGRIFHDQITLQGLLDTPQQLSNQYRLWCQTPIPRHDSPLPPPHPVHSRARRLSRPGPPLFESEITPHHAAREEALGVPRALWRRAGPLAANLAAGRVTDECLKRRPHRAPLRRHFTNHGGDRSARPAGRTTPMIGNAELKARNPSRHQAAWRRPSARTPPPQSNAPALSGFGPRADRP